MAFLESRQVVVWTLPTLALLLSLVWIHRRRRHRDSDSDRDPPAQRPPRTPDLIGSSLASQGVSILELNTSRQEVSEDVISSEDGASLLDLSAIVPDPVVDLTSDTSLELFQELGIECDSSHLEGVDLDSTVDLVEDLTVDLVSYSDNSALSTENRDSGFGSLKLNGNAVVIEDLKSELDNTVAEVEEVAIVNVSASCEITSPTSDESIEPDTTLSEEEIIVNKEEVASFTQSSNSSADCKTESLDPLHVEVEEEVCTAVEVVVSELTQSQPIGGDSKEQASTLMLEVEPPSSDCVLVPLKEKAADIGDSSIPSVEVQPIQETDKTEPKLNSSAQEENKKEEPTAIMEKGVLEEKLASLELDTMKISKNGSKASTERDSANQSPSEVMLASPSISNFSDAHSEGSSDSGKGHSDVATSPSRTPAGGSSLAGDSAFSVYEFVLPQVMVGRLIGRHGSFIHEIRTSTHTNIFIKRHPDTSKLKICAIEGTQQDIDKAIARIRHKFPLRRFPKLTLEKVSFVSLNNPPPLKPEDFHLQLVEGVNNDVIVSSLISAAHFFVQQPSHPSYSALSRLNQVMNAVYSSSENVPVLETPVKDAVCAASTMGGWYRAQIVKVDEDNLKCDVRFLDYGGYLSVESATLRQIRGDLLMFPFQAVECYLANVVPLSEEGWNEEARLVVQSLTHGQLLQAQIYDYAEDGTPLVYLYSTFNSQIVLINEELVTRGYAAIVTPPAEE